VLGWGVAMGSEATELSSRESTAMESQREAWAVNGTGRIRAGTARQGLVNAQANESKIILAETKQKGQNRHV